MDLTRLLRPRSIAVVGGREAAEVVRQCDRIGFAGPIHPVNPRRAEIEGRRCFASVADLPEAPDAAFVAVPREATIDTVRALAERGAGGAVCYASGFKETGEQGDGLQRALLEAAGPMPIIGPNCYGLIDYLDGAALWPDQHGGRARERGVALLAQSSNLALNLTMAARGLPIAYVVTLGNQARVRIADVIETLADDPRVTAIGIYVEGIEDPCRFERAARHALASGTPLVALKSGRSATAGRIALSHTASLAGGDGAADAFFARIGVARVGSLGALLGALALVHAVGPLGGRRLASMSCSGGEASLVADAADERAVHFPDPTAEQHDAVKATLSEMVTVSNPLDYHTFIWGDRERLAATYAAVMGWRFDLTWLVLDYPRTDRCSGADWDTTIDALIDARDRTGAPVAVVATLPECMPELLAEHLTASGIAPLVGIEDAIAAAEAAAFAGEVLARPTAPALLAAGMRRGTARTLDEHEAKRRLAAAGLGVPRGERVDSLDGARAAAARVGYPVVLKACSAALVHKTEAGAVVTGIDDEAALEAAFERVAGLAPAYLVEEQIGPVIAEVLLGIVRDPVIGPCLVLASGGVLTELVGDSRLLTLPASRDEIATELRALRVAAPIRGHRGAPGGDFDAVVSAAVAVADFACEHADAIIELDVNPLLVLGRGAVAADALIRIVDEEVQS